MDKANCAKMGKRFSIDKVVCSSRGYDEYLKMFDLYENDLESGRILDCAAGAASFTAELLEHGYDAVATDILYDTDPDILEKRCESDLSKIMGSSSKVQDMYIWDYFKDPNEQRERRTTNYRKFIKDYCKTMGDRYIKSTLPSLPFPDNGFSLVLSSHFLFVYDDRLGYKFHRSCIQEMLRVSYKEVRIFLLVGFDGRRSLFIERVNQDPLFADVNLEISRVPYEFFRGANEMLRITK